MKKRTILIVIVLLMTCVLFAEDARMLPAGILQTSYTGSFSFASFQWNENWQLEDLSVFRYYEVNAGLAAELGILEWLAAGLQWTPGFSIWSSFYQAPVPYDKATTIGNYPLYVTSTICVMGSDALVPSEMMRLTVSPLIKLPMFGRYFETEDAASEKIWKIEDPDRMQRAVGVRSSFDYLFNRKFYLNLYGEFLYYMGNVDGDLSWSNYAFGMSGMATTEEVDFRFGLTAEVEPHLVLLERNRICLEVGLPIRYALTPEVKFDGVALADSDTHYIMVGPNATLRFVNQKVPLDVKVGYALQIFGKNVDMSNAIVVSVQNRFRIYGK